MGLQPRTAAYIGLGAVATVCLGYIAYFDHQRRNNPELKKKIKKEKKKAEKKIKEEDEKVKSNVLQTIESVVKTASEQVLPSSPEEKEQYFMQQVGLGESLCNQGEAFYNEAILPFYLALRVYPAPMDLIMIYQKTVPESVFQMIINAMALDQQKRQNQFYETFPPKESNTKLVELPAGVNEEGKPIIRRGLVVNKDIAANQVIYTEKPIVSGLYPELEGSYCNLCLKHLETKVECEDCDAVVFCSDACLSHAKKEYHQYVCTKNKKEKDDQLLEFQQTLEKNNTKYPAMIARFLSAMVVEELEKSKETTKLGEPSFGAWDHVDRFRYLEITESPDTTAEIELLKKVLGPKVQGINEFLTDNIYLMLKGKLLYNAYAVPAGSEEVTVKESKEHARSTDKDAKPIAAALYKISTYISQSDDSPNVKVSFENDQIIITSLREIKENEELTAAYTLPLAKK